MLFGSVCINKQKGLSLIESIASSALILFVLSSAFLVINSIISTSIVTNKKVLLAEQLDKKINQYILTGRFNNSTIDSNHFFQLPPSSLKLVKFVAEDIDFNIKISKEVIKYGSKFN